MKKAISSNERTKPTFFLFTSKQSLTTPEFGLTVRTIMAKFAQGISVPTYSGIFTEDLPDLRGYDLEEIAEWKANNKAHIEDLEQRKRNGITDYNTAVRERREQLLKPNDKPKTENNE